MAENVSVSPTPIQRNAKDVAIELLNLHLEREAVSAEELSGLYAKYYTLAYTLDRKSPSDLRVFLPEEITSKFR